MDAYRPPWEATVTVQTGADRTLPTEGGVWRSQTENEVLHKGNILVPTAAVKILPHLHARRF